MVQWQQVRQEYEEQGASLRVLALRHGVGKSTIAERKYKEQWTRNGPLSVLVPDKPDSPPGSSTDAVTIARLGLKQLAQHLQQDGLLSIAAHKLLSDALAQYVKVLVTAPRETETQEGLYIPLERLLPETRAALRRILARDEELQQEEKVR